MKFYYTNSAAYNQVQPEARLSLGGFLSSSEIQNDILNNIFSNVSELSKQNLRREAILIALKNTYNEVVQGVTVTFDVVDFTKLISEYSIAFIVSKKDNCDNIYFDKINDSQALPFINLEIISNINKSFFIDRFEIGQVTGIWLIRKILKDKVKPLTCDELELNFNNNIELPAEENFSIKLSWTPDESQSDSI